MDDRYSAFFNLRENPFGETPDARFYFQAPSHAAALTKLQWAIQQGKGFSLLAAEVGTGKTLVSRILLKQLESVADTALVLFPQLSGSEIFKAISEEFGVPQTTASTREQLQLLQQFLLGNAARGRRTVLVVDEAQSLSLGALEIIRCLGNFETERQKLLQVLLVAQPEMLNRLKTPELRQLSQRITMNVSLNPLTEQETEAYVRHRLAIAGSENMVRFEPKAIALIRSLSEGIPRKINKYCEILLIAAQGARIRLIDQRFAKGLLEPSRRRWLRLGPGRTVDAGL